MPPLRVIISKSLVVRGDDNDHSSNVFLSYGVKGFNFDCTPLFFRLNASFSADTLPL
jgi:hypothetical protein